MTYDALVCFSFFGSQCQVLYDHVITLWCMCERIFSKLLFVTMKDLSPPPPFKTLKISFIIARNQDEMFHNEK